MSEWFNARAGLFCSCKGRDYGNGYPEVNYRCNINPFNKDEVEVYCSEYHEVGMTIEAFAEAMRFEAAYRRLVVRCDCCEGPWRFMYSMVHRNEVDYFTLQVTCEECGLVGSEEWDHKNLGGWNRVARQ